jgi:hypothetical protein
MVFQSSHFFYIDDFDMTNAMILDDGRARYGTNRGVAVSLDVHHTIITNTWARYKQYGTTIMKNGEDT